MNLSSRVLHLIRKHGLLANDDRVAVALSGGGDSVALLWLLTDLRDAGSLPGTLAGVLHVNHSLRGEESARDEAFCRQLADRLGLPIEVGVVDVAAAARAARRSIEATARDLRYRFFADAAPRLCATVVATGHTLDDQAETVLLRLLRGATSRGLAGIRLRRGAIIRPLLTFRREDLRRYLSERGESCRADASNDSLAIARNRVRHRLLPVIDEIAPGGLRALARFAALSADDEACLESAAHEAADVRIDRNPDGLAVVKLDAGQVAGLPAALGRRAVRRALETAAPGVSFTAAHIEFVRRLATTGARGHLDLPGVKVERDGTVLTVAAAGSEVPRFQPSLGARGARRDGWQAGAKAVRRSHERSECLTKADVFEVPLTVPGRVDVSEAGLSITAELTAGVSREDIAAGGDVAVLQASAVDVPFTVRSRRPGDRLRPLGAPGSRKLQDLLVDRKVPRGERDRVPLVVDGSGRIVWVVGLTVAEECRVTTPARGVVILKVHRKGSPT